MSNTPPETNLRGLRVSTAPTFLIRCPDGLLVEIRLKALTSAELDSVGTAWGVTLDPRQLRAELAGAKRELRDTINFTAEAAQAGWTWQAIYARTQHLRGEIGSIKRRMAAIVDAGWCCASCAAGRPCQ